jgi:hypothetical protein
MRILFAVLALALGLLLVDRVMRISPFLERQGFQGLGGPQRCGVTMAPCPHPLRCINGFCRSENTPALGVNPLPVLP